VVGRAQKVDRVDREVAEGRQVLNEIVPQSAMAAHGHSLGDKHRIRMVMPFQEGVDVPLLEELDLLIEVLSRRLLCAHGLAGYAAACAEGASPLEAAAPGDPGHWHSPVTSCAWVPCHPRAPAPAAPAEPGASSRRRVRGPPRGR